MKQKQYCKKFNKAFKQTSKKTKYTLRLFPITICITVLFITEKKRWEQLKHLELEKRIKLWKAKLNREHNKAFEDE